MASAFASWLEPCTAGGWAALSQAASAGLPRSLRGWQLANELPVYITEYDIGESDANRQKQVMESQFPIFYMHKSVKAITLWGYVLGQTWRDEYPGQTGLMTDSGSERPALT